MPIRRSPAKRSRLASASATTRVTMRPTVAQATPAAHQPPAWRCGPPARRRCRRTRGCARPHGAPRARRPPPPHARGSRPGAPGLQVGADHAQVQRPPAPPALPLVEAGAAPATPTAAAPDSLAGPHRHHQRLLILVEADPFDDRLLDTEQPGP